MEAENNKENNKGGGGGVREVGSFRFQPALPQAIRARPRHQSQNGRMVASVDELRWSLWVSVSDTVYSLCCWHAPS